MSKREYARKRGSTALSARRSVGHALAVLLLLFAALGHGPGDRSSGEVGGAHLAGAHFAGALGPICSPSGALPGDPADEQDRACANCFACTHSAPLQPTPASVHLPRQAVALTVAAPRIAAEVRSVPFSPLSARGPPTFA